MSIIDIVMPMDLLDRIPIGVKQQGQAVDLSGFIEDIKMPVSSGGSVVEDTPFQRFVKTRKNLLNSIFKRT